MLVFPEPSPNFTSPTKSRSPLRQVRSAPPSPTERDLGRSARAFSSTRLRSRHAASASRSAAAFQIPCLAWWTRAADLRAISARMSSRVRLSNSPEIASSQASSASLSRDPSWFSWLGTRGFFRIIAPDVIRRIAFGKKESSGAADVSLISLPPHADGQEAGVTSSASACSISSSRSNGSGASRSSFLTKVMIGTSRSRQTSKRLRVCSSMPLAASSTITAPSTAVRVR